MFGDTTLCSGYKNAHTMFRPVIRGDEAQIGIASMGSSPTPENSIPAITSPNLGVALGWGVDPTM